MKKPPRKGAPPAPETVPNNLSRSRAADDVVINFKVPPEVKTEIALLKARSGKTYKDIVLEAIELWKKEHGY